MSKRSLFLFLSLYSFFSQANVCEEAKCVGPRKSVDICFIGPSALNSFIRYLSAQRDCWGLEKHFVGSAEDIERVLQAKARKCESIKHFEIKGHGYPGYSEVGLASGEMDFLKKYKCLIEPKSTAFLGGCIIGKGCAGDLYIHELATSLFSESEANIEAPTTYSSSYIPFLFANHSLNFRHRWLELVPNRKWPIYWRISGPPTGDGGTLEGKCRSEINTLIDSVEKEKEMALEKGCTKVPSIFRGKSLVKFSKISAGFKDLEAWNYSEVFESLQTLTNMQNDLKRCRPPESSPGAAAGDSDL